MPNVAQPTVIQPTRQLQAPVVQESNIRRPSAIVVVDYFCGAGGATCGALQAGAIIACGVDCDRRAERTYVTNSCNHDGTPVPFITSRVEDLSPSAVAAQLARYPGQPTLFVGCPPCQPFTNLRTEKRRSEAMREALPAFVTHVEALRPSFVLVENVPGIRAKKYGDLWQDSVRRLQAAGYQVRFEVVNAACYGVPQKRMRTLLVAALGSTPPWPSPTHSDKNTYRTVRHAFAGARLCRLGAGQVSKDDTLHIASNLSPLNLRRIRSIKKPGGSRSEWPRELWLDCYRDHDGHTDVYGRMDWEKPAPTLTTRFVSISNGRFGHPEEDRAITPREGALLQTFPADYRFMYEHRDVNVIHIGNAVPPALARAFVAEIIKAVRAEGSH